MFSAASQVRSLRRSVRQNWKCVDIPQRRVQVRLIYYYHFAVFFFSIMLYCSSEVYLLCVCLHAHWIVAEYIWRYCRCFFFFLLYSSFARSQQLCWRNCLLHVELHCWIVAKLNNKNCSRPTDVARKQNKYLNIYFSIMPTPSAHSRYGSVCVNWLGLLCCLSSSSSVATKNTAAIYLNACFLFILKSFHSSVGSPPSWDWEQHFGDLQLNESEWIEEWCLHIAHALLCSHIISIL